MQVAQKRQEMSQWWWPLPRAALSSPANFPFVLFHLPDFEDSWRVPLDVFGNN